MMSKQKGISGMKENVARGYRAGGRAPKGYLLRKLETGAVRDGAPVTKSVLILSEEAPQVASYLKMRAAGKPRGKAQKEAGLSLSVSTLIGMEWNALTYAGHTVWNVNNERKRGQGYKGSGKRRPRKEWVIKENTHEALISSEEAEQLLHRLENSSIGKKVSEAKTGHSNYLLTGILTTPEGELWMGDRQQHYRTKPKRGKKSRWLNMSTVDTALTSKILGDMVSPKFVADVTKSTRRAACSTANDPTAGLRDEITVINNQIKKTMDLVVKLDDPDPALEKVNELTAQRKNLEAQIERLERENSVQKVLANLSESEMARTLKTLAKTFEEMPSKRWKELIKTLVKQIVLDPETLDCCIYYSIPVENRICMASPRGFEHLLPP